MFPLCLYDEVAEANSNSQSEMFEASSDSIARRDALTNEGLAHFQAAYPGEKITKEDIFYYVYGLLHSTNAVIVTPNNLSKELPRIRHVKTPDGFWDSQRQVGN